MTVATRRRWVVKTAGLDGGDIPVVIEARDGVVYASARDVAIQLDPEEVSRLVDAYRAAQAQALLDRGSW